MVTKSKNISLKKLPKFQKSLKSKFKDNVSPIRGKNKTTLKGEKIEKIKLAFKKSRIKNKKAIISLNKKAYNNKQTSDIVNSSFSELVKSKDKYSIEKFFDNYHELFYNIPKKGEKSHESLIVQSQEYINDYIDWRDPKIEQLLEKIELKENELNKKQIPDTNENLFYPNGTFLRTHGWDTEYVEGVPQGLPIWVMQEGMKREFKSYDAYKTAKRAAGFTNMWYDAEKQELRGDQDYLITELVHQTDLNWIPTGRDINDDTDLNLPSGPDLEIDVDLANILDYYSADLTCLEESGTCYIRRWRLNGTETSSNRWGPGETIHLYYPKDNPHWDLTGTGGINSNLLQSQAEGGEDGIFGMEGHIRFDYQHPENTPTKYVNVP